MICPRCTASDLRERDHEGVTVDVCPECRGVWLDRGELEKLITRATREIDDAFERRGAYHDDRYPAPRRRDDSSGNHNIRMHDERRRRKHWFEKIGDIFD
jgi:uncharacterized protein